MKTAVVIVGLFLVLCEGRIEAFRRPIQNREPQDGYFSDDYNDVTQEDDTNEDEIRESPRRVSEYESAYGYTKPQKKRYDGEGNYEPRKSKYTSGRSRGKYSVFGSTSLRNNGREQITKRNTYEAEIRDRKKEYRSIPKYESPYQSYPPSPYKPPQHYSHPSYNPPPQSSPSYKPVMPKSSCQQNLLIGCSPTVTKVPCGHQHHSVGLDYPPPPYQAPIASVPATPYLPSVAAVPVTPYKPHQPTGAYQHSHVSSNRQSQPSLSAPVIEDIQETPKRPFISAFPTTTIRSAQLPTVAADQDQNFRFAERSTNPPPSTTAIEDASGDEPEPASTPADKPTSATQLPTDSGQGPISDFGDELED
ncbi:adhesive plaque matrix protein-like [Malaya genurostris]|uniref:adhesive plaque matrix protein-like n=1 Tax=Malaya genurostris TaxID=325434 RepID=UPI0026F405DF|nr:adhesive plaque matrix protein-like [Malaya genurostris]